MGSIPCNDSLSLRSSATSGRNCGGCRYKSVFFLATLAAVLTRAAPTPSNPEVAARDTDIVFTYWGKKEATKEVQGRDEQREDIVFTYWGKEEAPKEVQERDEQHEDIFFYNWGNLKRDDNEADKPQGEDIFFYNWGKRDENEADKPQGEDIFFYDWGKRDEGEAEKPNGEDIFFYNWGG